MQHGVRLTDRNHPSVIIHLYTMGNSTSSPTDAPQEHVIRPQEPSTSVQVSPLWFGITRHLRNQPGCLLSFAQFSPSLLQQLSNPQEGGSADSASHHDPAILSRLQAEVNKLRSEEQSILDSISSALEKENLDKDRPELDSRRLARDLEEVREKVERLTNRGGARDGAEQSSVQAGRDSVIKCYL